MSGDEIRLFREAMSRVGAAVHIITTADGTGRHGLTASAVCSVTDTPPTLLFCLNRTTSSHAAFRVDGPVCVNTLAASQKDISGVFADRARLSERFEHGSWSTLATGAPVLAGSAASFDCRITEIAEVGTHSVVFAHVISARTTPSVPALMYFGRAYHQLPHMNEMIE